MRATFGGGRVAEAALHYELAIALDPRHVLAHANLAALWQASAAGRYAHRAGVREALRLLRRALALHPTVYTLDVGTRSSAGADGGGGQDGGGLGGATGNRYDAQQAFAAHALRRSGAVDALSNAGAVLRKLGRVREGVAASRQAARLNPAKTTAWTNYGLALLARGELAEGFKVRL